MADESTNWQEIAQGYADACRAKDATIAELERKLAEETERADANWNSLERVKAALSECAPARKQAEAALAARREQWEQICEEHDGKISDAMQRAEKAESALAARTAEASERQIALGKAEGRAEALEAALAPFAKAEARMSSYHWQPQPDGGRVLEGNRELSHWEMAREIADQAQRIEELERQLAEAQADKECMDWLEQQDVWIGLDTDMCNHVVPRIAAGKSYLQTVRAAIETARGGERG